MGQTDGYTAADYLLQHATRKRRTARVPASTWDALLSHTHDPGDAARLSDAVWQLADLLARRGDLDELRCRADAGNRGAARRLAGLLGIFNSEGAGRGAAGPPHRLMPGP